jgi:hypothetical protein
LTWIGVVRDRLRFDAKLSVIARIGIGVLAFALVVQPFLALPFGRVWEQAEVFGVAPDPTAVATLGLLLAANRIQWIALPIPLLWCLLSGTTLWVMNAADAFVLPMVASLVLILLLRRSAARR